MGRSLQGYTDYATVLALFGIGNRIGEKGLHPLDPARNVEQTVSLHERVAPLLAPVRHPQRPEHGPCRDEDRIPGDRGGSLLAELSGPQQGDNGQKRCAWFDGGPS